MQQLLSEEDRWLYSKRPILNCDMNSSYTARLTGSDCRQHRCFFMLFNQQEL